MITTVCLVISSVTGFTLGHQCCCFREMNGIDVTSYRIQVLNCTIMHSYGIDLDKYYTLIDCYTRRSTFYTIFHGKPLYPGYPILPHNLYTRRCTVYRTLFTLRYTLYYNLVVTLTFHSSTLLSKPDIGVVPYRFHYCIMLPLPNRYIYTNIPLP